MISRLELSIESDLKSVSKVERFVEKLQEVFGLSKEMYGNVALSVLEATNNAILHGNKENLLKKVKLVAIRNTRKIIVTVEDEGEGFDFSVIPDPTTQEGIRKESGRGVYLISKLTDELLFDKNGAKVVMVFLYR